MTNVSPQSYNVPSPRRSARDITFGQTTKAKSTAVNYGPSPFSYDPHHTEVGAKDITFHYRVKQRQSQETPGPGAYDISREARSGYKFSFTGRTTQSSYSPVRNFPGPGAYNARQPSRENPGYTFANRTNYNSMYKVNDAMPNVGPNTYQIRDDASSHYPSLSFRGRVKTRQTDETPAPGSYNVQRAYSPRGKGFTMGARTRSPMIVVK